MKAPTTTITRRLTSAFATVMAGVLLVGGVGIYFGERFALDRNINRELTAQSRELTTLIHRPGAFHQATLKDRPDSYAQILALDGEILASTPPIAQQRMLTRKQLTAARHGTHTIDRGSLTHPGGHTYRVRTVHLADAGKPLIALVAVRRDARDEALRELLGQLLAFGFGALALSIFVGYRLTRAAMEPVDTLRQQADELYNSDVSTRRNRLDIPRAGDEIERLASTLSRLLGRVDETVRRERTFAAAAGHELRTPLTALTTEIDFALRGDRSKDELVEALRGARVDAQRLTDLSEDLLLFSRIAGGELDRSPYKLSDACAYAVANTAIPEGRSFKLLGSAEGVTLLGNQQMMQRAIGNLLDNAINHGDGTITLDVAQVGTDVVLRVCDEGSGTTPDFLALAFEPFARDSSRRSGSGSGIGLALVREVVVAHGGTATLENLPGGGTCASLMIPLLD